MKTYRSHAIWSNNSETTDDHDSESQAQGVCRLLEKEFAPNSDSLLCVIKTWVTKLEGATK